MCCKCCLDNSLRVEHRAVPRFSLTRVKSEAQVPVSLRGLYRKREEAGRMDEHGLFARFRYNDLKEAALRRTRALCKLNGVEGWRRGVLGWCGGAQPLRVDNVAS